MDHPLVVTDWSNPHCPRDSSKSNPGVHSQLSALTHALPRLRSGPWASWPRLSQSIFPCHRSRLPDHTRMHNITNPVRTYEMEFPSRRTRHGVEETPGQARDDIGRSTMEVRACEVPCRWGLGYLGHRRHGLGDGRTLFVHPSAGFVAWVSRQQGRRGSGRLRSAVRDLKDGCRCCDSSFRAGVLSSRAVSPHAMTAPIVIGRVSMTLPYRALLTPSPRPTDTRSSCLHARHPYGPDWSKREQGHPVN